MLKEELKIIDDYIIKMKSGTPYMEISKLLEEYKKQQKLLNQLLEEMKERANNISYEGEILWRKIEKAEEKLKG